MHSIWSVRPVVLRQERPGPLVPELMWHDWLPLRDRLSHCPVWVPPCVRRQVGPHMPSKLGESLLSYFVRWVNGHKHFKCVYTYLTVVHIVNTTFSFLSQKTMEAVFTFSVNGCQQKIPLARNCRKAELNPVQGITVRPETFLNKVGFPSLQGFCHQLDSWEVVTADSVIREVAGLRYIWRSLQSWFMILWSTPSGEGRREEKGSDLKSFFCSN